MSSDWISSLGVLTKTSMHHLVIVFTLGKEWLFSYRLDLVRKKKEVFDDNSDKKKFSATKLTLFDKTDNIQMLYTKFEHNKNTLSI